MKILHFQNGVEKFVVSLVTTSKAYFRNTQCVKQFAEDISRRHNLSLAGNEILGQCEIRHEKPFYAIFEPLLHICRD